MEGRRKSKSKKSAPKPKKQKNDGPKCSMFLAEISRKLALKKRQKEEEYPNNIVQTIIDSLTNALPVKFSSKSPLKRGSPMKIETLQTYAPELLPNDTLLVPHTSISAEKISPLDNEVLTISEEVPVKVKGFKMPKMPLVTSDVFKHPERAKVVTEDVAVNTGGVNDIASELAKHVGTLRKISLIAEEFNQKTAKNLKEIVDSVQEDLLKKLEEVQAEKRNLKDLKQLTIDEQQELV